MAINGMINIRIAGLNDISTIYELNKSCLPIYYSYFDYAFMLLSPGNLVLLAEYNNIASGYLVGEYNSSSNSFHILSFGVHTSVRNKGIGRKLIEFLIIQIRKIKYSEITLNVHVENVGGIAFYEKLNFRKMKLLKNYYKGALSNVKSFDGFSMSNQID